MTPVMTSYVTFIFFHHYIAASWMVVDYLVGCQEVGPLVAKAHRSQP